jgi:hypothetical protein
MQRQTLDRVARRTGRRGKVLLVALVTGLTSAAMAAPDIPGLDREGITVPRELRSVVEHGLRTSPTFRVLFDYLNATPHVHVELQLQMPPADARAHSRLHVHRTPRLVDGRWTTRVKRLDGRVFVPPVVSRRNQIALVGHELLHVYRLLRGSRSESPQGRGERIALLFERQILNEIRSANAARQAVIDVVDLRRFSSDL